jgi:hypothetical protein
MYKYTSELRLDELGTDELGKNIFAFCSFVPIVSIFC